MEGRHGRQAEEQAGEGRAGWSGEHGVRVKAERDSALQITRSRASYRKTARTQTRERARESWSDEAMQNK